jgi:hypothetical protein
MTNRVRGGLACRALLPRYLPRIDECAQRLLYHWFSNGDFIAKAVNDSGPIKTVMSISIVSGLKFPGLIHILRSTLC